MAAPFQRNPAPHEIVEVSADVLPQAPREGRILGAAICEVGHVVLVMGDPDGAPVIEAHMSAADVDDLILMLSTAKRRIQQ